MKILLLGKDGQVGWELQRSLAPIGDLTSLGSKSTEHCGDLGNLSGIEETLRSLAPDVIVNAAAYTAVDRAEEDFDQAMLINAHAPGLLAELAARDGALLIHYSTDYVFDGSGSDPRLESDVVNPCNRYGETKAEGERRITASGCRHLIFRTSWVYAARGNNFLKTMLRLAGERDSLIVVDDQQGAPTGADLIADTTAHALRVCLSDSSACGLYHLAPAGVTSWHGFATLIINEANRLGMPIRLTAKGIRPVTTAEYPTPAARPMNSRLNTEKLQQRFQITLPEWTEGVRRAVAEIAE